VYSGGPLRRDPGAGEMAAMEAGVRGPSFPLVRFTRGVYPFLMWTENIEGHDVAYGIEDGVDGDVWLKGPTMPERHKIQFSGDELFGIEGEPRRDRALEIVKRFYAPLYLSKPSAT